MHRERLCFVVLCEIYFMVRILEWIENHLVRINGKVKTVDQYFSAIFRLIGAICLLAFVTWYIVFWIVFLFNN